MVSLRFYGGVGEIGGNKILLEDRDTRIWLDFGKGFNSGNEYYCGYLQPRSVTGLKDYFEFDLMPKVRGLYAKEMLTETEIKYKEPRFDAVVISHSHGDHVGHLEFIDPLLPVYTGTGTKLFMEAAEETSYGWKFGTHDYRSFRTGHHLKIGALEIRPIHVDHSVPGAYGFVIQTSEGAIVYTGDLRAHGPKAAMTEEFLTVASESKPCALIIEGTRMAPVDTRKNLSEAEVRDGVVDICQRPQNRDRLIVYTHGIRDMDRLLTFYKASTSCGRRIVISPRIAYLLSKLVSDEHLDLPDPSRDDNVAVYYRRKRSGNYDENDYYKWERPFLDKMVTPTDLRSRPNGYLVHLDFQSLNELIDIRPEKGTPFIFSISEHMVEEDVEGIVLKNWLNHFEMQYHQLHASGHMSMVELGETVRRISARAVFPIHTEHPEMFSKLGPGTILTEKEKEYVI